LRLAQKLRHRWEVFATRTGLRLLPPVAAAVAVVALGVLVPLLPKVDALPAQLAPSLAEGRLARFLRTHEHLPDAGPTGEIYASRPAFFWPEREGADGYAFRLYRADGTEQAAADGILTTFHMIPPPGVLAPGEYRFEVKAIVKGDRVPWQEQRFTVLRAPGLESLRGTMGLDLGAAESDYVLLGYYADLNSPCDVISAFLQWKATRGELGSLGKGPPAAWLADLR
jgi:hypothetical protein